MQIFAVAVLVALRASLAGLGAVAGFVEVRIARADALRPQESTVQEPSVATKLETALADFLAQTGVPGVSFACVLPNGEELCFALGVANREGGVALTPEHKLLGGSTGKTFVAAWALTLVTEGKLALSDSPARWLGEEDWYRRLANADHLTIENLLNHTSGLSEYYDQPGFVEALLADPDKRWAPAELLAYVCDKPALFEVGQGWSYADTNYIVAGLALERASQESFYASVERLFLKPYTLSNTIPSTERTLPGLACGYTELWRGQGLAGATIRDGQFLIQPQFEWTGGGFATNPRDLARWAKALFSGAALPADYLPVLLQAVPARTGPGEKYGLGVQIFPTALGELYGHGGFFPGYLTCMGYLPDHNLALALQVNTDDFSLIRRPLHRVLEQLAQLAL